MFYVSSSVGFLVSEGHINFVDGQTRWMHGVVRICGKRPASGVQCEEDKTGVDFPEVCLKNATGTICYCTRDLCNGPQRDMDHECSGTDPECTGNGSAPMTSVGRTTFSFTVISLLSLAANRFLSQ